MIFYEPPRAAEDIRVIDLAPSFEDDAGMLLVAGNMHKACRETGFFYVKGHGVAQPLIDSQFAWAKRFFDLPLDQKLAIDMKRSRDASGYEPMGGQVLDSQDAAAEAAPPDLKEGFYCRADRPAGVPDDAEGYGDNQWPALPGFREQMQLYLSKVGLLGDHLMRLLALSLDLPADWFEFAYEHPNAVLRLIKYPPHPANAALNQLGAGAHTDWGGVTLLAQDEAGGLEVRNAAGEWIQARPVPGTFVVNLGDLIGRWTNGVYSSNMHRVKNNVSGRDRYSIPLFYSPQSAALIEPIPGCVDDRHPRRFPTCTAAEHMNEMFRRSYGYSAASAGT